MEWLVVLTFIIQVYARINMLVFVLYDIHHHGRDFNMVSFKHLPGTTITSASILVVPITLTFEICSIKLKTVLGANTQPGLVYIGI